MKFTVVLLATLLSTTLGSYVIQNSITKDYLFLEVNFRRPGVADVFAASRSDIEARPSRHMFFDVTPVGDAYRIEGTATKLAWVDVPNAPLEVFGERVMATASNPDNCFGLWKTTLSPNEPDFITNKETGKYLFAHKISTWGTLSRIMTASWTGLSLVGGSKWVFMKSDEMGPFRFDTEVSISNAQTSVEGVIPKLEKSVDEIDIKPKHPNKRDVAKLVMGVVSKPERSVEENDINLENSINGIVTTPEQPFVKVVFFPKKTVEGLMSETKIKEVVPLQEKSVKENDIYPENSISRYLESPEQPFKEVFKNTDEPVEEVTPVKTFEEFAPVPDKTFEENYFYQDTSINEGIEIQKQPLEAVVVIQEIPLEGVTPEKLLEEVGLVPEQTVEINYINLENYINVVNSINEVVESPEQPFEEVVKNSEEPVKGVTPENSFEEVGLMPEQIVEENYKNFENSVNEVVENLEQPYEGFVFYHEEPVEGVTPENSFEEMLPTPEQTVEEHDISLKSSINGVDEIPEQPCKDVIQPEEAFEEVTPINPFDKVVPKPEKPNIPDQNVGHVAASRETYVIQNEASKDFLFVDVVTSGDRAADVFIGPLRHVAQRPWRHMLFTLTQVGDAYRIECVASKLALVGTCTPSYSKTGAVVRAENRSEHDAVALWQMTAESAAATYVVNKRTREYLHCDQSSAAGHLYSFARTSPVRDGDEPLGGKWLIKIAP